jgi:hypothetical protein
MLSKSHRVLLWRLLSAGESGQTAIPVLLLIVGILMISGLALDAGFWFFDHRTAQNQADAATAAASQHLPTSDTSTTGLAAVAAKDWLKNNGVPASLADSATTATVTGDEAIAVSCANLTNNTVRIVFSAVSGGLYNKVGVCIRRDSVVFLSGLTSITSVRVSAAARASILDEPLTYALMAMNPDGCATDGLRSLNVAGSAHVNLLEDGGSYTDSTCDGALYVDGTDGLPTFKLDASGLNHVHAAAGGQTSEIDPPATFGPDLSDPWAGYAQPTAGSCRSDNGFTGLSSAIPVTISAAVTVSFPPGTYCQPLWVTGNNGATVSLQTGEHIFTRGLLVDSGGSFISGSGQRVVVYMTCPTSPCAGAIPPALDQCNLAPPGWGTIYRATFCVQGNSGSTVNLTGPAALPGIAIWVDRTANTYNQSMIRVAGEGTVSVDGNIYAISAIVDMEGRSVVTPTSLTGTMVADKIYFGGTTTYEVTWDQDLAPRRTDLSLIE